MAKRFLTPIDLSGTVNDNIDVAQKHIKWSDDNGTLQIGLNGNNIKLAVGQEEVALCRNNTGFTLLKGRVVYISGSQGQRPTIALSSAALEETSSKTFGVVAETIQNNSNGYVCTYGILKGLDTSAFTEGSMLWLSTTAGVITSIKPSAPNNSVFIGYCVRSHPTVGQIFVNIQNGYEIDELHNVSINSPVNGHILKYDSAAGVWTNGGIEGASFEVFYQTSAPSSPQLGDIWIDSDESLVEYDTINVANILPSQTGNSGKFLSTDGSNPSWSTINLSAYATKESPTFTGIPTAPTALVGTNTSQLATTEFVRLEISNLIASAPTALDTLDELAFALNDDANFASTITTSLSGKEPTITSGTTSQYWRGDKTWQTLNKSSVGLGNVENTALSTWSGSSSITTVGNITAPRLSIDSVAYLDTTVTTVNTNSITTIDSFPVSDFTSVEYFIQIVQGSKTTALKAVMITSSEDITQYAIVESGGQIPFTISTDTFNPGPPFTDPTIRQLRITVTDANSNSATVKVVRTSVV